MAEISQQVIKRLAQQIVGRVTGPISDQLWAVTSKALRTTDRTASRAWLNLVLPQMIPFNKPMGLKLVELTDAQCEVALPYKKSNFNHLGGLHACALATAGEYTAGLLILRKIDPGKYRLILKKLSAEYSKQGRDHAVSRVLWPNSIDTSQLDSDSGIDLSLTTIIQDKAGVELARVDTLWQVKAWEKVRVK